MHNIFVKVILLDVEGTTTSINFVQNVLFPYAKENNLQYLSTNKHEKHVQDLINDILNSNEYKIYIQKNLKDDEAKTPKSTIELISKFINHLIQNDLKWAPLKTLQGYIWNEGYKAGILKGHVYPDVPKAFAQWKEGNLRIAIYSSGNVMAQKLLFRHSIYGDLCPYIEKHFDITTSGHKQDKKSYENIIKHLNVNSDDVLFLTDVVKEAIAARSAGMQVILLNRPGNAPFTDVDKAEFVIIDNFEILNIKEKL